MPLMAGLAITRPIHHDRDRQEWYAIHRELLHIFRHGSNNADVLLHQHPWLHEIDNALPLQTVESRARVAFLEDGVTFMSVLEKFAMARMWRDMLLEICIKEENAFALPFLSVLSDLKDSERYIDTVPFLAHTTSAVINYDDVVQRSQLSPEEQVKYRPFHDMLKSRCDAEVAAKESK